MTEELQHAIAKAVQVGEQFKVVAALCEQIAHVHTELQQMLEAGVGPDLLESWGQRSATLIEYLGDVVNGMDIVEPEDAWMDPIFNAAHAMFPQTPEEHGGNVVSIPQDAQQAEAMVKMGWMWLNVHAPDRLQLKALPAQVAAKETP